MVSTSKLEGSWVRLNTLAHYNVQNGSNMALIDISTRNKAMVSTSKLEGSWVRLNTLAHYNVQDGSNMALIDPQIDDQHQEQDYSE